MLSHHYNYESTLADSLKVNWRVEDLIGGDKKLDFTRAFLPDSLAGVAFPPPRDGFDGLAAADGCPPPREASGTTSGNLTTASREGCEAGTAAVFVTIEGGPHAWPGGTPTVRPQGGAGDPDYDATAEIVAFLLAHPRVS